MLQSKTNIAVSVCKLFLLLGLGGFYASVQAKVTLPRIFSDNMVLQRDGTIPVWGWAAPNEKVEVRFNGQIKSATADFNGKWAVKLNDEKAGGPFTLTVKGDNTITIQNVLVGEVWLCSGQSNMEWTVGQSMNAAAELAAADNPFIRHIKVARAVNSVPQNDFAEGTWQMSKPTTAGDFSGVAYFFAQNLYRELKIPIGLINATWGGTNIETWISREGFASSDEFKEMISRMPQVDIEALARRTANNKTAQVEALQGVKLTSFDSNLFLASSFDDARLPLLNQPGLWESQSLGELDGIVWLRKSFTLTAAQSKQTARLSLAMIDDEDITYVNGVRIGSMSRWDAKRSYEVPPGLLQEGKNVIVVKVTDSGGGGGIYGEPADLRLILPDTAIPLSGSWKFQVESIKPGTSVNEFPSLAYNGMINSLIPYSFRGVLWYQGESNVSRAYQYRQAFPLLINDWRKKWDKGKFPFYFVQLATFNNSGNSNEGCPWAELREAQTQTLSLSNTGMTVTTDIGDPASIHPLNKQEVGRRLAALALHKVYKKAVIDSGPAYKSMKIEGNKAIVTFTDSGSGLTATNPSGLLKGFEIAGGDQVFYEANAVIKDNTVIVTSEKVASPQAVRFGWLGNASADNLFNREGFPAVPFRTDQWKTVTKEAKYKIMDFE